MTTTPETNEQLTLDLPESTRHGVVYSVTDKEDVLIPTVNTALAEQIAANIKANRKEVTWDEQSRTSGLYGLEAAEGGALTHRISTY